MKMVLQHQKIEVSSVKHVATKANLYNGEVIYITDVRFKQMPVNQFADACRETLEKLDECQYYDCEISHIEVYVDCSGNMSFKARYHHSIEPLPLDIGVE